ncbi:hypothetical protein HZA97_03485 [Candidatus Woesearchaeota archaeon]|nr:hypothetical protein [Candidatus Woesearchaeota archaeon]
MKKIANFSNHIKIPSLKTSLATLATILALQSGINTASAQQLNETRLTPEQVEETEQLLNENNSGLPIQEQIEHELNIYKKYSALLESQNIDQKTDPELQDTVSKINQLLTEMGTVNLITNPFGDEIAYAPNYLEFLKIYDKVKNTTGVTTGIEEQFNNRIQLMTTESQELQSRFFEAVNEYDAAKNKWFKRGLENAVRKVVHLKDVADFMQIESFESYIRGGDFKVFTPTTEQVLDDFLAITGNEKTYNSLSTSPFTRFDTQLQNQDWSEARKTAETLAEITGRELQYYLNHVTADEFLVQASGKYVSWFKNKDSEDFLTQQKAQESLEESYALLSQAGELNTTLEFAHAKEELHQAFATNETEFTLKQDKKRLENLFEQLPVNYWGRTNDLSEQLGDFWNNIENKKRQYNTEQVVQLIETQNKSAMNMLRRAYQAEADKAEEQLQELRFHSVAMHDLMSIFTQPGTGALNVVYEMMKLEGTIPANWTLEDAATEAPEKFLDKIAETTTTNNPFINAGIENWRRHKVTIDAYNNGRRSVVEQNLVWERNAKEYIANTSEVLRLNEELAASRTKIVAQFGENEARRLDNRGEPGKYDLLQQFYSSRKDWVRLLENKTKKFENSYLENNSLAEEAYLNVLNGRTLTQAVSDYRAEVKQRNEDDQVSAKLTEKKFFYELIGPVRAVKNVLEQLGEGVVETVECCPCDLVRNVLEAGEQVVKSPSDLLGPVKVAKGLPFSVLEGVTKNVPYVGAFIEDLDDNTPLQNPGRDYANAWERHVAWQGPNKGYVDVIRQEVKEFGSARAGLRALYRTALDGYFLKQVYDHFKSDNRNQTNNQNNGQNPTPEPQPTPNPTPEPTPTPSPTPTPDPVPTPSPTPTPGPTPVPDPVPTPSPTPTPGPTPVPDPVPTPTPTPVPVPTPVPTPTPGPVPTPGPTPPSSGGLGGGDVIIDHVTNK